MLDRARIALAIFLIGSVGGGNWSLLLHEHICHSHAAAPAGSCASACGSKSKCGTPQTKLSSPFQGEHNSAGIECGNGCNAECPDALLSRASDQVESTFVEQANPINHDHSCAICFSLGQELEATSLPTELENLLPAVRVASADPISADSTVSIRLSGRSPPMNGTI